MSTDRAQNSHVARRLRHGSGAVPRILTTLYALVMTPIALAALSFGGVRASRLQAMNGYAPDQLDALLTTPEGLQALVALGVGLALLVTVVITGSASSAGLLLCGVLGVGAVLLTTTPALLQTIYQHRPEAVPLEVLDGLLIGFPLLLLPLLGGLGGSLVIARRRPDPHAALSLLGLVLVPLGLVAAMYLLLRAHAHGALLWAREFRTDVGVMVLLLAVLGAVLLWGTAAACRWSPYSLLVPSLLALLCTAAVQSLVLVELAGLSELIAPLWHGRTGSAVLSFLLAGGGLAVAAILFVHTIVLAAVRARSRRRARLAVPSAWDDAAPVGTAG